MTLGKWLVDLAKEIEEERRRLFGESTVSSLIHEQALESDKVEETDEEAAS